MSLTAAPPHIAKGEWVELPGKVGAATVVARYSR